ncbi:MAG: type I DNA topoisomerase [Gammaproteobacteria bacterium]|nr:MAG: type I DNA topoisomerase [Gammaproteobacteria bacterium]
MSKQLVIVESPAKAKTIKKYLGRGFEVMASYGHVRDLVPKSGAVDPEHDFAMKYEIIEKNAKHVDAIARAMRRADTLYLATDPDREGEAISWHLSEILRERGVLEGKSVQRVVFHEITRRAIAEAVAHPRAISMNLVNAQQARRALDYLVGFNLSPLLWKKVRRGLSAGRVQSPALRLIVEREEEIERFQPREYWTLDAQLEKAGQTFTARLTHWQGRKLEQFDIAEEAQAQAIRDAILAQAGGEVEVVRIERKQRRRNPAAPFITSTLQQEASRKLGFSASRTMRVAQQLYEGIDIGEGSVGLITYMRTDSVNLAAEAVEELRTLIRERFGKENLPAKPRTFKTRAKNAQEAHEAIRPTSVMRTPEALKPWLTRDQHRLYDLIWKRTVACQMVHATIHTVGVDFRAGEAVFRATGSTVAKPGFMAVYQETPDEQAGDEAEGRLLPPLEEGERVPLRALGADQHFTEPPPRYTEASLVRTLEEYGIGRPSTYATILSTLQQRGYVTLEKRRFHPTDVGRIVSHFLTEHFPRYVDYDFTARLEDDLDEIARGEREWKPLLRAFWEPFIRLVKEKEASVTRAEVTTEALDECCPECGRPLQIKLGRRGRFIGCSGYPECGYTRNLGEAVEAAEPEVLEGRACPECGRDLVVRSGRYGKFIGCSGYPECKYIEPLEKPEDTGVPCPECGQGTMLKRRTRSGKVFYSCSTYPACKYAVWNEPLDEACPACAWPMLTLKTTRRRGTEKVCPQCRHSEAVAEAGPSVPDAAANE